MDCSLFLDLNTKFSPLLWRSIRCNLLLRCVCWDRGIVGLRSSLSMNNIWIFSEFFYVWLVIFASLFELSVWFGLLDWSFLQWEKCLALGLILRCPLWQQGQQGTYCIVAIGDNKMGFSSYFMSLSLYIMSSYLRHYSVFNLILYMHAG